MTKPPSVHGKCSRADSSSSANGGSKTGSDNHTTRADVVDDDDYDDDHCPEWRVPASRYEEVTWAHGGLYEAFQALADPRRVVFSMGVVDDGPHHEGGDGAEGGADATPVVVQDLLGLSVQQVRIDGAKERAFDSRLSVCRSICVPRRSWK